MTNQTRRRIVGGMSALATMGPMFWIKSAQAQTSFKPEKGAKAARAAPEAVRAA